MASPTVFAERMRIRAQAVNRNAPFIVKRVSFRILETVVRATPVLTGRARRNWLTSLGKPDTTYFEEKPDDDVWATEFAISSGREVINRYRGGRAGIFISNNAPYIGVLNEGSSSQQPVPGFIERAMLRGREEVPLAGKNILSEKGIVELEPEVR